jgi:tetratricopeptide (TPR) repeat protein
VRQTLLAGISAPRRQRLHARVAEAIERLHPDAVNERAGEIANHLLIAGSFGDSRKLLRYLTLAGKSALEAAAFEEAWRSFVSALSYRSAVDPRERADLLASLAMAGQGLERWDEVFGNLHEALDIYVNLGDRDMVGKSFTELTNAYISAGNFQEAAQTARRGLAYLEADVSANRGHLLASLAHAVAAAVTGYKPANEALREALNIASQLSDQRLEARVLGARSLVNLNFFRLKEAAVDSFLSEQLGGSETPPWQHAQQLRILLQALLCIGRLEEALRIADELEPLAKKIGQSFAVAFCLSTRAWSEFGKVPDLAKLETDFQQVSKFDQKVWAPFWEIISDVQLSLVDYVRGNWAGALSHAQVASRPDPRTSSIHGLPAGTLFRQMAYAGDRAGAMAILHENRVWLAVSGQPNIRGSWWMLALVIEGLVILGEQSQAGQLYPLARELIDTGAVVLWPIFRFTQTIAGVAAAAARQWGAAEEHFQTAMQQADSLPYRLEQADICRFHAMMLTDRAAPGDREKAQLLLSEALKTYTHIGMLRHIEMAQKLLAHAAGRQE